MDMDIFLAATREISRIILHYFRAKRNLESAERSHRMKKRMKLMYSWAKMSIVDRERNLGSETGLTMTFPIVKYRRRAPSNVTKRGKRSDSGSDGDGGARSLEIVTGCVPLKSFVGWKVRRTFRHAVLHWRSIHSRG